MQPHQIDPVPFVQATVHADAIEVDYVRGGRGAPVLMLIGGAGTDRLRLALCRSLAECFRVLAPEAARVLAEVGETALPAPRTALPLWLPAFLEGLGLPRVSVVADEWFGAAALGFALLEPERIHRLVLLRGPQTVVDPEAVAVVEAFDRPGQPLPVLHLPAVAGDELREGAVASLAGQVARFLAADAPAPIPPC